MITAFLSSLFICKSSKPSSPIMMIERRGGRSTLSSSSRRTSKRKHAVRCMLLSVVVILLLLFVLSIFGFGGGRSSDITSQDYYLNSLLFLPSTTLSSQSLSTNRRDEKSSTTDHQMLLSSTNRSQHIQQQQNQDSQHQQHHQQQVKQQMQRHQDDKEPIQIAHCVSLIKCEKESTVRGLMDALVVLRHSIHQNSVHHQPTTTTSSSSHRRSRSRYSYQMYAFVHKTNCPDPSIPSFLRRLGYIPILVETPVRLDEINDGPDAAHAGWYRNHVEGENCCGSAEFIKLYPYKVLDPVKHPIFVHWDLDVLVLKPLDLIYDAMLFDDTSVDQGRRGKQRVYEQLFGDGSSRYSHIQRPKSQRIPSLDENTTIDAFFTRDVTSSQPWEPIQPVQGGFVVARPDVKHFDAMMNIIRTGDYVTGRGPGSGWFGRGYGGFQGAMAYQGILAYYYGEVYTGHHIELNVCKYNQVVADVIWRGPNGPSKYNGTCRDYPAPDINPTDNTPENGHCYDCRILPIEETLTVHYTACKKPWECVLPTPRNPRDKSQVYRLQHLTNMTTCKLLFREYFHVRQDLESKIHKILNKYNSSGPILSPGPLSVLSSSYEPDTYLGYCSKQRTYVPMAELSEDFDMKQVYGF